MSDNLLIMTLVKKANLQQVSFAGTVETTMTEPAGVTSIHVVMPHLGSRVFYLCHNVLFLPAETSYTTEKFLPTTSCFSQMPSVVRDLSHQAPQPFGSK